MLLTELAKKIGAQVSVDTAIDIQGVQTLDAAGPRDISFLAEKRYEVSVATTAAAAVLVSPEFSGTTNAVLLVVDDVAAALDEALAIFAPPPDTPAAGIHPAADVSHSARLGKNVAVGAFAQIGDEAQVGDNTVIGPGVILGKCVKIGQNCNLTANVVIQQHCSLGDRVTIHPNSTIGADGFGYRLDQGRHKKIAHIGTVIIEDDVEIGANSCVDRAKFGKTVIGRGTKIDNLVQIAHNVRIGEHCIVVAQTGIAGSCQLGRYVVLAGQCAVSDHLKIGDGAMAGGQSGITKHILPGQKVFGTPARNLHQFFRDLAQVKKIAGLEKSIKELKKKLDSGDTKDHS